MNKASLRSLILAAEFAVIIAVLSQFTIPLGIVPLTGQTFAIGLTATVLGKRTGTYAILIYFGPTGGYLIGFIFNGLLTGYILEKTTFNYTWAIIANIAGALVTLVFGMIWLKYSANLPWPNAFAGGFAPFIIPGIIKAVAAAYVGILIRQRFMKRFLAHLS